MKKIITLVASVVMGLVPMMAQYMPSKEGTVLTYTETSYVDGEQSADYKATVVAVTTAEDGVITVNLEEIHKIPGNDFADIKDYTSYTYNPADGLTTIVEATPESTADALVNMLVEGARSQGQNPSESDIAELRKMIKIKGELSLPLPATADPDAKVPNQTMTVSIATQTMKSSLWEIKYLGYEDVEVPAGKFENCLKVSYVSKQNNSEGVIKKYCTSWFAKNVGEIKSVAADKKGKIEGECVLKEIKE